MLRTRFWKEITAAAVEHKLDPVLVEAIVVQESAGNTDAFRFEKDFWNRLMKPNPRYASLNPRRYASSYGLMQPMWVVATERGLDAKLPPEMLFIPEIGLKWGCRQLAYLTAWADQGWPQIAQPDRLLAILASYNGGRGGNIPGSPLRPQNRAYAQSVLKHYQTLTSEHQLPNM